MLKRIHWCIWVLAGFSEDSILVLFVILVSKLHLAHWFGQPLNIRDLQVVNSVNWPMGRLGSIRRAWATVQRQREETSYWICHKTIFFSLYRYPSTETHRPSKTFHEVKIEKPFFQTIFKRLKSQWSQPQLPPNSAQISLAQPEPRLCT